MFSPVYTSLLSLSVSYCVCQLVFEVKSSFMAACLFVYSVLFGFFVRWWWRLFMKPPVALEIDGETSPALTVLGGWHSDGRRVHHGMGSSRACVCVCRWFLGSEFHIFCSLQQAVNNTWRLESEVWTGSLGGSWVRERKSVWWCVYYRCQKLACQYRANINFSQN